MRTALLTSDPGHVTEFARRDDVVLVLSDEPAVARAAERFAFPFEHVSVEDDRRPIGECAVLKLLDEAHVEHVVVGPFAPGLSDTFVSRCP